jgi:hypothetical protein
VPHVSHLNRPISVDDLLAAVSVGPGGDVLDAMFPYAYYDL